jgi:hypothetical protein
MPGKNTGKNGKLGKIDSLDHHADCRDRWQKVFAIGRVRTYAPKGK